MTDSRRAIALALLVSGAFFMENLDGTVITTAIPQMAHTFGTNVVGLSVGITAYLLSLAVFVPMSGWIADRHGARTTFCSAIAAFTISSVLCGFAQNVPEFTMARILQGIGGAMMVPVGRLVVLRNTEKRDLITAIAMITWPGLVAPILGPPIGGFITDHANWRWIFFLNVPLGLIAMIFALKLVPNLREPERPPFDWTGFFLTSSACLALSVGLDQATDPQTTAFKVVLAVVIGLVLGALAIRHLRRAPYPLVRLDALKIPTFALTIFGTSFFRCAIGATPYLLPLLFQVGFGLNATQSGLLVLWVFAGNLAMKPATTAVLRWAGFKNTLLVNGVLAAVTLAAISLLSPSTPYPIVALLLFSGGLFRSMQFTATATLGFADVPQEMMSGANVLATTTGGLTFGAGPAMGAIGLHFASWIRHEPGSTPTLGDFRITFGIVGLFALISLWDTISIPKDAGREVSRHKGGLRGSGRRKDGHRDDDQTPAGSNE